MTQIFAAMVKSGLTPEDIKEMKAETHADEIVAFTDSIMSCGQLDQVGACRPASLQKTTTDFWLTGPIRVHL